MIEFSCIYCGRLIRAGEKFVHKRVKCPACGHSIVACRREPGSALRPGPDLDEKKVNEASHWGDKGDQEVAGCLLPKAMTKEQQQEQLIKSAFSSLLPRYDDLTLFALSLSFVLLWLIDADLELDLAGVFTGEFAVTDLWLTMAAVLALIGMVLSLFNVFLRREKSWPEKGAMLVFALVVTVGTGLYAGWIMLSQRKGWLLVFPAWNILSANLLLILFALRLVGTDCITDEPASFGQLVITAISVPVLLTVCHYYCELHWAVTFSIAVAYTMSLHNGIRDVFGRRGPSSAI